MASYFEYPAEDLDRPVPVLLSLRELRALELALNGDTWPYSSRCPWFQALQSAQLKLWAEIDRRRIELDRALKNRLPF
ncbi:hypothetical protein [Pseudomonas aeruginosa]|uniref:hypothetical protein n=1 Tax=Pseudomonas aeruginosa TaxID=287 RepID=UPI0032B3F337